MSIDSLKQEYIARYITDKDKFHRDLLINAFNKLILLGQGEYRGTTPELEYLEDHNQFLFLYRRDGNEGYLEMAKIFRKVAHRIYRIMLKKGMTPRNVKFLNSV